jgi:hypothetical protein
MLATFRCLACLAFLCAFGAIFADPATAGLFAGLALGIEAIRLAVAFTGNRL